MQRELELLSMAVFVIQKEGEGREERPADIGIIIEGVEVLHELTSVASAVALLLGLIYALILAYQKPLRFTFEVLQKNIVQKQNAQWASFTKITYVQKTPFSSFKVAYEVL